LNETRPVSHSVRVLFVAGIIALILSACQAITPPRLATREAATTTGPAPTAEKLFIPAPTATANPTGMSLSAPAAAPQLNVWLNETSPEHRRLAAEMARDFTERTGIDLAVQLISSPDLPDLVHTAVLSDTLPDVIIHPLEYTIAWTEAGILDPDAGDEIVNEIGRETFDRAALDMVDYEGKTAAIPSDGFQQLLIYRSDWFEDKRLDSPDTYAAMLDSAESIFDPENITSGLVIPTESNLISTQRAFEHLAIANGCRLIDETGEVALLEPACRDALDFYFSIINQYSPPGVQTDTSARNAFLDGRTGMIMTTPSILPALAEANRLDRNTGIVTNISGEAANAEPTNFGNITYMGITPVADRAAAAEFAGYWFNEGYQNWLAVESERKVPMRLGTVERPRFYIDAWGDSSVLEGESLRDIYGDQIVTQLRDGISGSPRWGFGKGQGGLTGQAYEKLTFSIVLQEMLSGYFNSEKTIFEAYKRVTDLIPNYAFPLVPTPEP
jgi:multiple sugar transport system substrate-binding protein